MVKEIAGNNTLDDHNTSDNEPYTKVNKEIEKFYWTQESLNLNDKMKSDIEPYNEENKEI